MTQTELPVPSAQPARHGPNVRLTRKVEKPFRELAAQLLEVNEKSRARPVQQELTPKKLSPVRVQRQLPSPAPYRPLSSCVFEIRAHGGRNRYVPPTV